MILTLALSTSLLLTFLIATAVIARSGLRGTIRLLSLGIGVGLLIGPLEHVLNLQGHEVFLLIEPLVLQYLTVGIARAMIYGLGVAVTITAALSLVRRARRRSDIWYVAVGVGLGLGLSSTWFLLAHSQSGWPPFMLVTAIANMPFQLCFALIVSAALIKARFPQATRLPPLLIYAVAVLLAAIYHAVLSATLSIGHWLAWMEPLVMGEVWLLLIATFWLTGLAVMASQKAAAIPSAHHPAKDASRRPLLMRPGLWKLLALLVIAPAFGLFFATWYWNFDTPLGRVMIYTLLATPLLAGSLLLRTALALEDKPMELRLR